MGEKLAACGTAFQLRKCSAKNPVYHKCSRKCQFKFPKSNEKGAFPNENALLKLLYLRINELYKKWNRRPQNNWALVRNQLDMDEKIQERIRKYENGERLACPAKHMSA